MNNVISITQPTLVEHAQVIRKLGKRTLADVLEIGRRLVECREITGDGFGKWLKAEFSWTYQTALNFIRLFELAESEDKNFLKSDFPISSLYLLAAPETPPDVRAEIFDRVRRGEKMNHSEIVRAVRNAKQDAPKEFTGLKKKIVDAVKAAGANGLTTDEARVAIPDAHAQTVNSAMNALAKAGFLRDSGQRRETRSGGGRKAIAYVFSPRPRPQSQRAMSGVDQDKAINGWKGQATQLLKGKTNYQIANIILDVIEACGCDRRLIERLGEKRDLAAGKIIKLNIFGPMPQEFTPGED